MTKKIDFIFDFASPNAYFSYHALQDICARTGAEVNYHLALLGGIFKLTGNQAPMLAFGNIKGKLEYDMLETQRFIAKHGIDKYSINPHFPVTTVGLMRGAIVAEMDGDKADYITAMLAAMWEQGLKLDDPEVLQKAWADAGFDAERLAQRITEDDVKQKLIANTDAAVARGTFGIPTFYVGDEMFFGKERLSQLEELL